MRRWQESVAFLGQAYYDREVEAKPGQVAWKGCAESVSRRRRLEALQEGLCGQIRVRLRRRDTGGGRSDKPGRGEMLSQHSGMLM